MPSRTLPAEILEMIIGGSKPGSQYPHSGVDSIDLPRIKCVSRDFRRAALQVEAARSEELGYPVFLRNYVHLVTLPRTGRMNDCRAVYTRYIVDWLTNTEPAALCAQFAKYASQFGHGAQFLFLAAGFHAANGRAAAELYLAQTQGKDMFFYSEYYRFGLKLAGAAVPEALRFAVEDSLVALRTSAATVRFASMVLVREALWTEDSGALGPLLRRVPMLSEHRKRLWEWADQMGRYYTLAGIPAPKLECLRRFSPPDVVSRDWAKLL